MPTEYVLYVICNFHERSNGGGVLRKAVCVQVTEHKIKAYGTSK